MKDLCIASDFEGLDQTDAVYAKTIANEKFQEWWKEFVSQCPVIYGWDNGESTWSMKKDKYDDPSTHHAKLFDIREVEEEKCDHNHIVPVNSLNGEYKCSICGVKVLKKITWEIKDD